MKRKLFFLLCALLTSVGMWAQGWTASEVGNGDFYLYNVGGQGFLAAGARWGSHAVVSNEGSRVTLAKVSEGVYTIATPHWHESTHWFADNGYMDSNETQWTFEAVPGLVNTYKLKTGDNYAHVETGLYNVMVGPDTRDSKSYWKLVTSDNRTDYSLASTSNPQDVSFKINNARFELNTTGWTGDCARGGNGKDDNNNTAESGWNTHNACVERFHASTDVYQELTGLNNGKYIVKCQGFYRADSGSKNASFLYANDASTALILKEGTGDPNSMTAASTHFSNWEYVNSVTVIVTDGKLKFGVKTTDTNNWTIFDNFQIFYCGNDVSSKITNPNFDSDASGWTGAGTWGNSEVEFYNTTGGFDMYQDLSGLDAGIYAVELQGFYRNGAGIDEKRAKAQESLLASIYAKGEDAVERSTSLLSIYEEAGKVTAYGSLFGDIPNWMNQAQDFISAGYYKDNKVIVEVGAGGTLRIGAKKTGGISDDWTILDNFSLTKLNYATLAEAYAAEWTARKTSAQALLNNGDYSNIVSGSIQRTDLSSAVSATPSDLAGYISALAALRTAVNNFKAAKYAYNLYATNAAAATEAYNAEGTTYVNVTGDEKTTFNTAYATNVSGFSPATNNAENYYNAAVAIGSATDAFTNETVKNSYNEYAAEVATAALLETDASGVATPTTAAAALTAAHSINVLNYNKVVAEEYEDVSASTLGAWTDTNVGERSGQHWDGTNESKYFEMNSGWGDTSWNMSRSQTVNLAAGKYILKVACRVSTYANATLSVTVGGNTISTISGHQGDTGKGITTSGVASYDEGTFANENNGRGFEWKYIPFELAETGNATLSFTAEGHALHQYVSFTSLALLTDPKVAARTSLLNKINEANTKYNNGANVGAGIFQVPAAAGTTFSEAIDAAQDVYDDEDADLSAITGETTTLNTAIETYEATELNAPTADTHYKLTLADRGALTYTKTGADDEGGYELPYQPAADYKAQTFFLNSVSGNDYTISFIDGDGETRYICTGENAKAGLGDKRIRTTTDEEKALTFRVVATTTANVFNLLNTESGNSKVGSNGGGMYTADNYVSWSIAEASKATAKMVISAIAKKGTFCAPFAVTIPANVKAYTVTKDEDKDYVTLDEVSTTIPAGTPVLVEFTGSGDVPINETFTEFATVNGPDNSGVFKGVFGMFEVPANVDNYILQYQGGTCAFYPVKTTGIYVGANRCYLYAEAGEAAEPLARIAIGGEEDPTAINAIEAAAEEAESLKDGKYLIDGQIIIVKNGIKYSANGQILK